MQNITASLSQYIDTDKITSIVNKVKNAVYNYTEWEIKVRDATGPEAWGASSTLMLEIAAGTFNYVHMNEIMDTLYKRLADKTVTWRQIYKSLQLLEYLVKNGSERVVDVAREHAYDVRALKSFVFVDEKGKDQGINVRNRAKEIVDFLADTNKIKEERKKAKINRNKYTGVASDGTRSSSDSHGYTGFGRDSPARSATPGGFQDDPEDGTASTSTAETTTTTTTTISSTSVSAPAVSVVSATATSASKSSSNGLITPSQPKVANLLDFDISLSEPVEKHSTPQATNDWSDFATSANKTAVAAAPQAASGTLLTDDFHFADFTSSGVATKPVQQAGFAAFPVVNNTPHQQQQPTFAAFGSSIASSTPPQTQQQPVFANFASFSTSSTPVPSYSTQPTPSTGFAAFSNNSSNPPLIPMQTGTSTPTKTPGSDIFGSLVSLDPMALNNNSAGGSSTVGLKNELSLNALKSGTPKTVVGIPQTGGSYGQPDLLWGSSAPSATPNRQTDTLI
ncbi:hypothetical protein SmJEL517_g05343 [Synchytrium microbalum]|uniref:ENTH domain-containing protein n=1 Tax=Synchytrium microbalum TaxID=1806994 RepID=A0A507BUV9_9FUNG|nr:uncharacterized protein SmJEL517_g05343 [Synchytrium microbalum]TPX31322.1 hypothetical protein SmJEL517_g05343 [Synchytrium microbalum]